ncbi:hypothetical protein METP3_00079 [Methanosarcinales archaeon]|nr:hypothetical protein METP3_00079 [Methanosarcinales archaeon]
MNYCWHYTHLDEYWVVGRDIGLDGGRGMKNYAHEKFEDAVYLYLGNNDYNQFESNLEVLV